jgi:glycosyltransferase involved in cell wall biosynthesis
MKMPLVSILIPAHNMVEFIVATLRSAVAQTWPRKEVIVVDDGSIDRTAYLAQRFASKTVKVVSTENQGLSAAVNYAFQLCQGEFIQELDADDCLAPDKIERQLAALRDGDGKRILLSSPWAHFYYRTRCARFVRNSLWHDLSPVEWLFRKMNENLHMQNATWLVSRELAEAAGPWDVTLSYDQDGEYFSRVLLASEGTRFVPEAKVFYRLRGLGRVSHIGSSDAKKESLLRSLKVHVKRIRSLEESDRVRKACLAYLQTWFAAFYFDAPHLVAELQNLAADLQGRLEEPMMSWKYAWVRAAFGSQGGIVVENGVQASKQWLVRNYDRALWAMEARRRWREFSPPDS